MVLLLSFMTGCSSTLRDGASVTERVTVRSLVIVDGDGRERMVLCCDERGKSQFLVKDLEGRTRIEMSLAEDGKRASVEVLGLKGERVAMVTRSDVEATERGLVSGIELDGVSGGRRGLFHVDPFGWTKLVVLDEKTGGRVTVGCGPNGPGYVYVRDETLRMVGQLPAK